MIEGVKIYPKKQIFDERGKIMHMLRKDDENFKKFGEIYFSVTYPNVVKAWHLHNKMTINYAVISGKTKLVLFDDRLDSKTKGKIQEIYLSEENYCLIEIPPKIWNGFKSISNNASIIANCSDIPHDPREILRKKYDDPYFSYDWKIKIK